MLKKLAGLFLAICTVIGTALSSFAAMSAADITATTTGISDALTLFYTIGGAILVVMASIWGFRKIQGLLGR
ncbi:major capsid protein [Oryzomonas japonica]|nr:major capsid protein [Oryzomonas japonica]